MNALAMFCIYNLRRMRYFANQGLPRIVSVWIALLFANSIRSLLFVVSNSDSFRDFLMSLFGISLPFIMFLAQPCYLRIYFKVRAFLALITALFAALLWKGYGLSDVPHILMPFSLFVFYIPFVKIKWRLFIFFVVVFSFFYDVSVRINVLLLSFCLFLLLIHTFFYSLWLRTYKLLRYLIFILPLLFVFLGYLGIYNVFKDMSEQDVNVSIEGSKVGRSYNVDSRSQVYSEFYDSMYKISSQLVGDGPVSFYEDEFHRSTGPFINPRMRVEPGILNITKYYGALGFLVFFILFWKASNLAVNYSNNDFIKFIGIYAAFKFFILFIEEPNVSLDTYFAVGLCFNSKIREMGNNDIKNIFYS